jgi:hypothetical protein
VNIGFAVNAAAVESVSTTYTKVTLSSGSTDAKGAVLPAAGYISGLELKVLKTSGNNPATATFYLTWDETGDHLATEALAITLVAGATSNVYGGFKAIDRWFREPTARAGTAVYAWVKMNDGTVTVQLAKLHWCDSLGR